MAVSFNTPTTAPKQAIAIEKLYGVDLTNTPTNVAMQRSPNAVNMIRDTAGKNRKRMGWQILNSFTGERINGCHVMHLPAGDQILIHAGENIYLWDRSLETYTTLYSSAKDEISSSKQINEYLWIFDGKEVLRYDGTTIVAASSVAYVPTIIISRAYNGGGTPLEPINLIGTARKEMFYGDGVNGYFQLTTDDIDADEVLIKVMRTAGSWTTYQEIPDWGGGQPHGYDDDTILFSVNRTTGKIRFADEPPVSPVLGEDNIEIQYCKTVSGYADKINKCTISAMYGVRGSMDRIFVSGNPDFPNYDWYCQIDDPSYWGDTWYSVLGQSNSAIMGYGIMDNHLAAFKSESENGANIYIRYGNLVNDEAAFQVTGTYLGAGAVAQHSFAIADNEPLYLTASGVHALTPRDNTSERSSELRSYFINGHDDNGLLSETLKDGYACTWNGFYILCFGEKAYLLDSTQSSSEYSVLYSRRQFEGYIWDNIPARIMFVIDGDLYFGSSDGDFCAFYTDVQDNDSYTDGNGQIVCDRWETPFIFGASMMNKTTWTYLARYLSYYATGDEVLAEINGTWYPVGYKAIPRSTDMTPQMLGQIINIRNVSKVRFAFVNEDSQPHGIEKLYFEYRQGGKYSK